MATKEMQPQVLQSCVLQGYLDFIYPYYSSFPEAALGNLLALLVIMRAQEQRVEFFMSVGPMYQFPNMAENQRQVYIILYYNHKPLSLLRPPPDLYSQSLSRSVHSSVRRFRELGLNNKTQGPKFNSLAAARFMQLCFRSLSYGIHSFETCLLLEQVTLYSIWRETAGRPPS
jgi:hypothetical protein